MATLETVSQKPIQQSPKEGLEKPKTQGTRAELADLRDTIETQQQEAGSTRLQNAVEKTGGLELFLAELGKLFGKDGALAKFLNGLSLRPEDIDHVAPKIDEDEKPAKAEKPGEHWNEYLSNAEQDFGVPAWSVMSILRQETVNFNTHAESPFTSAKGLAQATDSTWKEFLRAPGNPHFKESTWTNPATGKAEDSRFNPEAAIYFTAWYIKQLAIQVDRKIDRKGDIEGYSPKWRLVRGTALAVEDMNNVSLAYHSGAEGYLRWRKFQESGDNSRLFSWQKRERMEVNGKQWKSYADEAETYQQHVANYAKQYKTQMS